MRHTHDRLYRTCLAPVISSLRIFKERVRTLRPHLVTREPPARTARLATDQAHAIWWSQADSNRRPSACKADALPAELWPLIAKSLVGLGGVEPPTSPLSGVRSNQLSYRPELNLVSSAGNLCGYSRRGFASCVYEGGDPAAGSPTATLLRLHPSH